MSETETPGALSADPVDRDWRYSFLDMGRDRYGDCVVARHGDLSILIDGGHPRDLKGQVGVASIPDQLAAIFGHPAPFDVTLVVVTHCHNDHIGCLPELIAQDIVRPAHVLVSDPSHGFPAGARDDAQALAGLPPPLAAAAGSALAGFAEEDHSGLSDADLALFLDAVVRMRPRYEGMLATLETRGVPLVRWGVSPVEALLPIYEAFAGTGFDIIAPTVRHLELCRDQIIATASDQAELLIKAADATVERDSVDIARTAVELYRGRSPAGDAAFEIDRKGQGSALNCQSIMIKLGEGDRKALLTGDMQFAAPEVDGLDVEMAALLHATVEKGPYRLVKLPHHTSDNAIDVEVWRALGRPGILVHSGGSDDPSHPQREMLAAFDGLGDDILFARTDRNGLITIDPTKRGRAAVSLSRGGLNDFSANARRTDPRPAPRLTRPPSNPAPAEPGPRPAATAHDPVVEVIYVKIPLSAGRVTIDGHEITFGAGAPASVAGGGGIAPSDAPPRLGGGRALPRLLFVTDTTGLRRNLGQVEAAECLDMLPAADVIDLAGVRDPHLAVRRRLGEASFAGVVLVGGYDVVAAERVDTIDPVLRAGISRAAINKDPDGFIVWSDDIWGDTDGDGLPEIPVSRLPDGRDPVFLKAALSAPGAGDSGAFGIRNAARPFADSIYSLLNAPRVDLMESAPTHWADLLSDEMERGHTYFMLHGDDRDASRFWGDDPATGQVVEAINVSSVPKSGLDVVFAGCCWGALSVLQRANCADPLIAPRAPEQSMALATLAGGARAFVGCTGVHYSPMDANGSFFGGPMHRAFWETLAQGHSPAEALFLARKAYLAGIPHGRTSPLERAIELKIYKQFTCLGLGW